jgi:hypothetical protein
MTKLLSESGLAKDGMQGVIQTAEPFRESALPLPFFSFLAICDSSSKVLT